MAKEKAEKSKKQEKVEVEKSLEQLILEKGDGKYEIVSVASAWASELHHMEEYRHLTQNELLELALKDVLSGKVEEKEVRAKAAHRAAHTPPSPAKEKEKK